MIDVESCRILSTIERKRAFTEMTTSITEQVQSGTPESDSSSPESAESILSIRVTMRETDVIDIRMLWSAFSALTASLHAPRVKTNVFWLRFMCLSWFWNNVCVAAVSRAYLRGDGEGLHHPVEKK